MAFRKKAQFIAHELPDILVVPECEHPDKLKFPDGTPLPTSIFWYGKNVNKGVGVFSYTDLKFRLLDCHNPEIKTILPISVTGGEFDFVLFAIWAFNPDDKDYVYVGQIWKAIHYYEEILASNPLILAGDFNSNAIWDKPKRKSTHTMVVNKLAELNIFSTYHLHLDQIHGKEAHPTYFLYRHQNKPYHLDYCFASKHFTDKLDHVEVGAYEDWTAHSDHKPLKVTFSL